MSRTGNKAARSTIDRSLWLTVLGIGVAVGVLVLGSIAVLGSRNDTWRQAQQSAGNLLLALDRDIARNIAVLDLSLVGVMEAMAEPGIDEVSPAIRQHALFDRSASAEDLGSILILDTEGRVVADSTSLEPHQLDLSDRDYFKVHQQASDVGLYISRPFRSRLAGGDLRFSISRRIDGPNGKFAGVVSATLRIAYLLHLFEKLDIGSKGTIALIREDGRMLVRYPFRPQDIDVDLSKSSSNFGRMKDMRSGRYVAISQIDGTERLYTFRHLGNLPLILTVSLSTEEILQPWRRKTAVIGSAMVVLCGSAVLSALLFRREMVRRTRTEHALAELADRLHVQASTDGLTGLSNRRAFDLELDRAFSSAVRRGTTLAVLMLDADYFKRFNDTYGHVAGDDVLRAIAQCLRSHLRRPYDTGARYGGEEFVAILPDTDIHAAFAIADRIRDAVKQLGIQHSGSPLGTVTVSLGVAVTTPLIGDRVGGLLQRADQGLYAAKQAGRNSTRCMPEAERSDTDHAASLVKLANAVQHDPIVPRLLGNAADRPEWPRA